MTALAAHRLASPTMQSASVRYYPNAVETG
jgi:hypothetical protein